MPDFELFDSPGADVAEIVTDGDTIKPFLNVIKRVDSEAKVRVTEDGLRTEIVDPANVFMADVSLPAASFEDYELHTEDTLGVPVDELRKLVRRARKNTNDELTLSVQEREVTATVRRGYENHEVVSQGTLKLFNPDSIRGSPEIPSLEWDVELAIDTAPFTDALGYAMGAADHVEMSVKGVNQHARALYVGGETDTRSESVAIDNVNPDETASAIYSADYMSDVLAGIGEVDAEALTLRFDEESPAYFDMTREDTGLSVTFFIAPRVTNDD